MIDPSVTSEMVVGIMQIVFIPSAIAIGLAVILRFFNSYD